VRHHARRAGIDWLARQVYLDPYPISLALGVTA
jgi:uncharacterized protein YbgA (DUF1722 family)